MDVLSTFVLGYMISVSAAAVLTPTTGSSIFAQEDSLPFFDVFDTEMDATENDEEAEYYRGSAEGYDASSAAVTYDKNEYLGDVMQGYYDRKPKPPPPIEHPTDQPWKPTEGQGQGQMGGYGKIDISIQYGCCEIGTGGGGGGGGGQQPPTTPRQEESTTRPPRPPSNEMTHVSTITIDPIIKNNETARFIKPPTDLHRYGSYGSSGPPGQSQGFQQSDYDLPTYMGHRHQVKNYRDNTEHYRNNNNNNNDDDNENQNREQFYHNSDNREKFYASNNNNDNRNNKEDNNRYTMNYVTPTKIYPTTRRTYEMSTTSMRPFSSSTTLPQQRGYTHSSKRYNMNHEYEKVSSEKPAPTPVLTTETPPPMHKNFGRQQNYENPPVLLAEEQFYTIQNPSFYPPTMSPVPINRGLPIPAERSAFYSSERLLPINLYGGYVQQLPVQGRFYQASPTTRPRNVVPTRRYVERVLYNGGADNNGVSHVTPRSILQDVSKIVIQDVPTRDLYSLVPGENPHPSQDGQQPSQQRSHHTQPSTPSHPRTVGATHNYPPTSTAGPPETRASHHRPRQTQEPLTQNDNSYTENHQAPSNTGKTGNSYPDSLQSSGGSPESRIERNRKSFISMQRMAYDLFNKAALSDFRDLLSKAIDKNCIEVLPEEKSMLDTKSVPTEQMSASILDYLTIYERYSDALNDTELANHILQDMDRAKEYLTMKLNKFWLELDAMETPAEFLEKKAYYKSREKPTGIMNIFYEWFEKMVVEPASVDKEKIEKQLVEIMKKERRYWLLLLRT